MTQPSSQRLVVERTFQAQVFAKTIPIMSGTTIALAATQTALSGTNVYFDPADFSVPAGFKVQARLVCLFTGAAVSDELYADVYDTTASALVLNQSMVVADSTGLVRLVGTWQDYPTVIRRGSIRARNNTAVRGSFRTGWLEIQTVQVPS